MDVNALALLQNIEEEEQEMEEAVLNVHNAAAALILYLEEGIDAIPEAVWQNITVNIEEYRAFSDVCFAMHFRMSKVVFTELENVIGNHLRERGRLIRIRTPLFHILLMVVWILANPDSFRSTALHFGVSPGVLHYHYSYVLEALRELAPNYIKWPGAEERNVIKGRFQGSTNFPGVVGCVDCTHIFVTKPVVQGERYVNRHHSYSLVAQAIVDHNLLVRDLYVGEAGSVHDSRTFRRSPIYSTLMDENNTIISADEHLLGDGAYITTHFLMTPFTNNGHLTRDQLDFNTSLSQGRVRVENSFALNKNKWRRLKFLYVLNERIAVDHVSASFVLHNFTGLHGEPLLDVEELAYPIRAEDVIDREPDVLVPQAEHPFLEEAQRRGEEKRWFILEHVRPVPRRRNN